MLMNDTDDTDESCNVKLTSIVGHCSPLILINIGHEWGGLRGGSIYISHHYTPLHHSVPTDVDMSWSVDGVILASDT